jgi:hypothetical protein
LEEQKKKKKKKKKENTSDGKKKSKWFISIQYQDPRSRSVFQRIIVAGVFGLNHHVILARKLPSTGHPAVPIDLESV